MLERPLYAFYIVRCLTNVNILILRIFDAKPESAAIIPSFPTPGLFGKVTIPYADANIFIIKESSVKLEKVDQMFAQVDICLLSESFVLSL